jgi:hypothetical protein
MMGGSYQMYEEEISGFLFGGGGWSLKKQTAWKA